MEFLFQGDSHPSAKFQTKFAHTAVVASVEGKEPRHVYIKSVGADSVVLVPIAGGRDFVAVESINVIQQIPTQQHGFFFDESSQTFFHSCLRSSRQYKQGVCTDRYKFKQFNTLNIPVAHNGLWFHRGMWNTITNPITLRLPEVNFEVYDGSFGIVFSHDLAHMEGGLYVSTMSGTVRVADHVGELTYTTTRKGAVIRDELEELIDSLPVDIVLR